MLLKDLISKLTKLYSTYTNDEEYMQTMGEPEIMIDKFKRIEGIENYSYVGYSKVITIDKSADGAYDILDAYS